MPRKSPGSPEREGRSRRLLPSEVSGKWAVAALTFCMLFTGLLIPLALKKPLWVELEIVVGVWWFVWGLTLTRFLYMGHRVSDDYSPSKESTSDPFDGSGVVEGDDLLGCFASIVFSVAAMCLAWVLIEFVLPVVFVLLYILIRGMLVHAVHGRRGCEGSVPTAAFWGFLWATVYTAPLALTIWAIHYIQTRPA